MIYVTGDCHGELFERFNENVFPEQNEMNKNDIVIVLGDFGGVFYTEKSKHYKEAEDLLDWLDSRSFTTVFLDGNHENFARLNAYPVMKWNCGNVHVVRPSILHLMRGEVFEIENKTFFVMGGASSHDLDDGVLETNDPELLNRMKELVAQGKRRFRVKGKSWWAEELPSQDELKYGQDNLLKYNNQVDYILSHSASTSEAWSLGFPDPDVITDYLDEILAVTEGTGAKHLFGHLHRDVSVGKNGMLLFKKIVRLA